METQIYEYQLIVSAVIPELTADLFHRGKGYIGIVYTYIIITQYLLEIRLKQISINIKQIFIKVSQIFVQRDK